MLIFYVDLGSSISFIKKSTITQNFTVHIESVEIIKIHVSAKV